MTYELGDVILERNFDAYDRDQNVRQVTLRVGKPQLKSVDDREFWYCPHQLVGAASEHVRALRGMDALDALMLTLKLAHLELDSYARRYHKKITWLGEDWLGLPEFEVPEEGTEKDEELSAIFENVFNEFFRNLDGSSKGKK